MVIYASFTSYVYEVRGAILANYGWNPLVAERNKDGTLDTLFSNLKKDGEGLLLLVL